MVKFLATVYAAEAEDGISLFYYPAAVEAAAVGISHQSEGLGLPDPFWEVDSAGSSTRMAPVLSRVASFIYAHHIGTSSD